MSKKPDENDEDEDLILIDQEAALQFVRDAFGITNNQHVNFIKKVKELDGDSSYFAVLSTSSKEPFQSYKNLLKIFLKHEIESSKIPHFCWSGKFSFLASSILSLHAEFLSLDETVTSFARWSAFISIHYQFPLNLKVYHDLLDATVEGYKETDEVNIKFSSFRRARKSLACLGLASPSLNQKVLEAASNRCGDELKISDIEIIKSFWESSQKLSENFMKFIRQIHYEDEEINKIELLKSMCEIEKRIGKIISMHAFEKPLFVELVKKALTEGTAEHLSRNVRKKILISQKNAGRLRELIRVMRFAEDHLKKISSKYAEVFES